MNYSYQIKATPKGRNILIVRGLVPLDNIDAIKSEDFDAIYIEDYGQSHSELSYQLQGMSSIHGIKSHLKPRFLAATLKPRVHQLKPLVDGFAATPDDEKKFPIGLVIGGGVLVVVAVVALLVIKRKK